MIYLKLLIKNSQATNQWLPAKFWALLIWVSGNNDRFKFKYLWVNWSQVPTKLKQQPEPDWEHKEFLVRLDRHRRDLSRQQLSA